MKTYKFKLYQNKRNKHLHLAINAASSIYNHCIALHKCYYRLFGKHLNVNQLMKHIAKKRKRNSYWQLVGSQAVQDICQRIDKAYKHFFQNHSKGVRPPNFKKRIKYKSFTLKQAGYKFIDGNKRNDWFWKLAHELTDKFDYLFFETLNLKGMKRLWGRKVSDLAFGEFLKILEFVGNKKGKVVSCISQWYPSSKTCSKCNHVLDKLPLDMRYWVYSSCGAKHGRDANASYVIHKVSRFNFEVRRCKSTIGCNPRLSLESPVL